MTILVKPVVRRSQSTLDGSFGPDRGRAIVVKLVPGDGKLIDDLIELRPERTRRIERIAVIDVYRFAVRCRAQREALEKARAAKEKKAERLARERLDRAERKFRKSLRSEREALAC